MPSHVHPTFNAKFVDWRKGGFFSLWEMLQSGRVAYLRRFPTKYPLSRSHIGRERERERGGGAVLRMVMHDGVIVLSHVHSSDYLMRNLSIGENGFSLGDASRLTLAGF